MVTEKKTSEKLQETETSEKFIIETKKNTFENLQKDAGKKLAKLVQEGNATDEDLFKAYRKCDGLTLARLVKEGKVTSSQLLKIAIKRTESVNPEYNAVIRPNHPIKSQSNRQKAMTMEDKARQTAMTMEDKTRQTEKSIASDAFKGVPFLLKDILAEMANTPLSSGSRAFKDNVSKEDSEIVGRFKEAGLVIFGKTNLPELALLGVTEPKVWGPTLNPWNTKYSTGGSSGGSAAAVAAGIVPVAHAADGGGSIRIPASCTGLFGLKPSRGRTPGKDFVIVQHVISRSVRDSAAMLDAIHGNEDDTPFEIEPPEHPYLQEVYKGKEEVNDISKKFKIMFLETNTNPLSEENIHDGCLKAVENVVEYLKNKLGYKVDEDLFKEKEEEPLINGDQYKSLANFVLKTLCVAMDDNVPEALRDRIEPFTRFLVNLGRTIGKEDRATLEQSFKMFLGEVNQKMQDFYKDKKFDFYLTPTLARLPLKIDELNPNRLVKMMMEGTDTDVPTEKELLGKIRNNEPNLSKKMKIMMEGKPVDLNIEVFLPMVEKFLSVAPWASLANFMGNPAMSVPLHLANGLPVGVQFMAAYGIEEDSKFYGHEDLLFRLAGQLEEVNPWFYEVPPL